MFKSFSLFRSSFFLLLFGNLAILVDGIYRVYLSRNLTADDFGLYSTIISTFAIFSVLNGSFLWWSNKKQASFYYEKQFSSSFLKKSYLYLLILNCPIFAILFFGRNYLNSFYEIDNSTLLNLMAVNYIIGIFIFPLIALVKGQHKFELSSFMNFCSKGMLLGLIFFFIFSGFSLIRVFQALLINTIVYCVFYILIAFRVCKESFSLNQSSRSYSVLKEWKKDLKEYFHILIFLGFIVVLMSIDIILVKKIFDGKQVGDYAVASMWAKLIVAVTSPLLDLIFPLFSRKNKNKLRTNHSHPKTDLKNKNSFAFYLLLFSIMVALVVNLFFYLTKEEIHANQYNHIGLLVFFCSVSAIPLVIVQHFSFYCFNKKKVFLKHFLSLFLVVLLNVFFVLFIANNLYHLPIINGLSYVFLIYLLHRIMHQYH